MNQPGAPQLATITTSQLSTIVGGVVSPDYRLAYPGGPCGWHLPSQPAAPHAPPHPPAPHPPTYPPAKPPTCHPVAPPTLPYQPMSPGYYQYGGNPWGLAPR